MKKIITEKNRHYTKSISPLTGETLGYSPQHSLQELQLSIKTARKAQEDWAAFSIKKRCDYIRAVQDFLVEKADELAQVISSDNGKTRIDALLAEVIPATMAVSYYTRQAAEFISDHSFKSGNIAFFNKRTKIIRLPYGVIGIISPWNYPFSIAFSKVIMAILAGNAVVLKTATETQMVGLALKECIEAAQLPEGIFTYVNMPGKIAGDAFIESGIDKLFFTGSVAVGRQIMSKAAHTLTPVNLELGGNDAMLICRDANLHRAVTGAVWAGFHNAGQSCGSVERVYVHEAIYDPFLKMLKHKVEALKTGIDCNFEVDVGVMTTQQQIDLVKSHVDEALSKGAVLFAQSQLLEKPYSSNLLPAMVLTDVNHTMKLMREETFGPVFGIMKVTNIEQAIFLANDSNLGLTGSVWSTDIKKAERIARKIQAGVVTINDHLISHAMPEASWGGFKESGIGRTHGKLGFDEMTYPQTIVNDIIPYLSQNLWWYPSNYSLYKGLKGLLEGLYSKKWSRRFRGFVYLSKLVPRLFK